jgi:hypothetical protein
MDAEPRWHRNLRTAANAGAMSQVKTIPCNVEDVREALEVIGGFTLAGTDALYAYQVGAAIKDPRALLRLAFDRIPEADRVTALRELTDVLEAQARQQLAKGAADGRN